MTQINLGKNCNIDLKKLLKGRMIISAMSGAGKTWTLRRLLEQSHGKVQQIVFDLEGEFSTLREKFDYILAGKGKGVDIQIDIKIAETLARKILEMNVSTIIDLYELKHHERILFVKRFLEAMVDAPKELWHSVLVVIDETHIFAPQDSKCESKSAVIDMATRGRKRGYALVSATQRPSQLEKDVSSQCTNKLIGRFTEDIDMKRAGYELGFVAREDILSLRNLQDGEFYAIGIAISSVRKKVKIGSVLTTHYEAGTGKIIAPPKPTAKIKAILSKLADLPKEAEQELKTMQDFRNEITRLKIELRKAQSQRVEVKPVEISKNLIEKAKKEGAKETEIFYLKQQKNITAGIFNFMKNIDKFSFELITDVIANEAGNKRFAKRKAIFMHHLQSAVSNLQETVKIKPVVVTHDEKVDITKHREPITYEPRVIPNPRPQEDFIEEPAKLREGAMRILKAVAMFNEISRERAKTISGISSPSTFSTYVQELKRNGWIELRDGDLIITEEGMKNIDDIEYLPTDTEFLIKMWSKFFREGAVKMLKICVSQHPESITREDLRMESGIQNSSTFSTYLQELKRNGLIKIDGNEIKASEELFE